MQQIVKQDKCVQRHLTVTQILTYMEQWNMYTCDGVVKAAEKHGPC